MCDIDVAVVSLDEDILADLVSAYAHQLPSHAVITDLHQPIYEGIVQSKFKQKVAQLILDLCSRSLGLAHIRCKHAQGEHRLPIHFCGVDG